MPKISASSIASARSTKYASPELYTHGSAEIVRDRYLQEFGKLGYKISVRHGSTISGVRGFRRNVLFLAGAWPTMQPRHQARLLAHEFVHAEQRRRLGRARFQLMYLRPGNAFAFECHAYREGLDFMRAHPELFAAAEIAAEIVRVPRVLWDSYPTLRVFDRGQLTREAVAAMG